MDPRYISQRFAIGTSSMLGCDDLTPLHLAVLEKDIDTVQALLEKNHSVDALQYNDGVTPLLLAAENNLFNIAKILIEAGANVNVIRADSRKTTPLHEAVFYQNKEFVTLLIEKNANVNVKNHLGSTPLHIAVRRNHLELIVLLIESGKAYVDARDHKGLLPIQYAESKEIHTLLDQKANEIDASLNELTEENDRILFFSLPNELIMKNSNEVSIGNLLTLRDMNNLSQTCRRFYSLFKEIMQKEKTKNEGMALVKRP